MKTDKLNIFKNWVENIVENRIESASEKSENTKDTDNIIYNSIVKILTTNIELNPLIPSQIINNGQGVGTGFFIDNRFNILTAAHVVKNAIKININIPEHGKITFPAKIVCVYNDFDLAIIKLDISEIKNINEIKNKITPLELGNSESIDLGDQVYALGYPDNSEYPMRTSGTISGRRDDYMQTDTPINGGNSGGPLLDKYNKVIGINSAVLAGSEDSSLVIPINSFLTVKDNMLKERSSKIIHKNVLGILLINGSKIYNNLNNIDENIIGQVVKGILPKSPVQGILNSGDIITKINNYQIDNFGEISVEWEKGKVPFDYIIKRSEQDSDISLEYYSIKQNKIVTDTIKLKSFSEIYPIREIFTHVEKLDYECFGGIVVMNLNLEHITQHFQHLMYLILNEEIYKEQLVISHIYDNSEISNQKTLFPGMLLKEINGIEVSNLSEYRDAIKRVGEKNIIIIKSANDNTGYINTKTVYENDLELSKQFNFSLSELDNHFHDA